ncbi:nucleotide-diphospho-sugar transferase [Colletotrichum acutatum]|uniref:Nucleotide-diphospho-sugar transferase n=1 Tax=Glomerella acutata TaxID=27357 RepID=A0AAD8UUD8_GLOAC|nr:nucleotide-diphospho-sugar transferase [Colletotrichum acutatum]KAK1726460.1 nucleotide-diphospho-sugar transferase [Colletotrichum acutatum]
MTAALVVHQLSYTNDFALPNQSIEVIRLCNASERHGKDFRDTIDSKPPQEPIPKIIHQIWKDHNVSTYRVRASYETWKHTMEPLNYTVKLWTDEDVLKLIKTEYSWLLSTYEGYAQNIQRADVARLVVVHAEGGMYADLDVYPRSTEEMSCIQSLGLQAVFAPTSSTLGLSNHFFMAQRGSSFLEWALQEAKRRGGATSKRILLPYLQVFWSTGPIMVTYAFHQYAWMYSTLHHGVALLDEGYARKLFGHAAGRSWHGSDGQFLNYVSDHLGTVLFWVTVCLSVLSLATIIVLKKSRGKSIDFLVGCGSICRKENRVTKV